MIHSTDLEDFARTMRPGGGWGYYPDQDPHLEPSCFALLALSLDPSTFKNEIARTWQFIESNAMQDGSYRPVNDRPEAVWPTPLVLFTKSALGTGQRRELQKTVDYLLGFQGPVNDGAEERKLHDIDTRLAGWSWAENNFYWVEPTAWACLALSRTGQALHPRVKEGRRLLLDRAMDEGGINHGSRRILGRLTEPIPGPTALTLLALQGEFHPRIKAAAAYLVEQTHTGDLEHLCWTKLALDCYVHLPGVRETVESLDDKIRLAGVNRGHSRWLKTNCYRSALMILALGVERHNFFSGSRLEPQLGVKQPGTPVVESTGKSRALPSKSGAFLRLLRTRPEDSRKLPASSGVHIARASSYENDLAGILGEQYEHFRSEISLTGKRVVIKPNLVEWNRDKVINTNPQVIGAVIELCKREGAAEIVVAEGPGTWRNADYLVAESGLGEVLDRHGVEFVDINHDDAVKMRNAGRLTGLEHLYVSRTIATAEVLISVPKLKTHHWAGATLALKNLFGVLPGKCYGWPKNELHWRGIHHSIVDIALTRTPDLAIVDGIVGMEGDGPINGTARTAGVLVMGNDLVAVDATCCRLMMIDPEKITYLEFGRIANLGRIKQNEIPQLGEPIAAMAQPFVIPPNLDNLSLGLESAGDRTSGSHHKSAQFPGLYSE